MANTTLTLEEVKQYIFKELPRVLEQDPQFVIFIEGIVAEKFPRRDELARMLDEGRQHREETKQQFGQMDNRFDQLVTELQQHRQETGQRFDQVDQQIDQVATELQQHRQETGQRFDQVDQRFEQVDQRFEQVDQRFEQVDQRFEQVDQRFEQVDQRFEQVDKRFDQLEARLDQHQQETRQQFVQVAENFRQVGERFDRVERSIDRLGHRWGIRNELLFRQTMRTVLEDSFGAQVEERWIGGEQYDCIIIHGQHILIEISASVGIDILKKLQRKRQLYIDETGINPVRFILAVGSIYSRRAEALRADGFDVIEPEEETE